MTNKTIPSLPAYNLPFTGGELGIIDDGTTTYNIDVRYLGWADVDFTYNVDGTINTITKAGKTKTFTWVSGRLEKVADDTWEKQFWYDIDGNLESITVAEVL